ncbi:ArsR family transcriptional regulator [Pseudonocardiaceae bacterium YIM PH 21723]|nr:ArsR family transcriptional regulator [Pseudonocardiaceae bacterium YIM PH 21723]
MRVALLDLLADRGTVTSTEAATSLNLSSGLCSFHLRQLARHGLVEEADRVDGRARPWQLSWGTVDRSPVEFSAVDGGFDASIRVTEAERDELLGRMRELVASYDGGAGTGQVLSVRVS